MSFGTYCIYAFKSRITVTLTLHHVIFHLDYSSVFSFGLLRSDSKLPVWMTPKIWDVLTVPGIFSLSAKTVTRSINRTARSFLLQIMFVVLYNPVTVLTILEKQLEKISSTAQFDRQILPHILVVFTLLKLIFPLNSWGYWVLYIQ